MGKDAEKGLQVLGVGLSRTGTSSLAKALEILGYKTIHFDDECLNDIIFNYTDNFDFRCYDHVDAVLDIPSAYFYDEILTAYPDCKAILTVRDPESWFKAYVAHEARTQDRWNIAKMRKEHSDPGPIQWFPIAHRRIVYGSHSVRPYIYKKKYRDHNRHVQQDIDKDRLLVMDIFNGAGWPELCGFLDRPIPDIAFPCVNRGETAL